MTSGIAAILISFTRQALIFLSFFFLFSSLSLSNEDDMRGCIYGRGFKRGLVWGEAGFPVQRVAKGENIYT